MSSLYDTLFEQMQGKPYSNYFTCCCPFHQEQNPSFFVYEDGFRCASCGKRGSLAYLAKYLGHSDYVPQKSFKVLPQFRKWLDQYGDIQEIAYHAHRFLKVNRSYQKYLRDRKLEEFIEPGMFGFKDGWITIPVKDEQGKVVDIICRGISKEKARYVLLREDKTPRLYCPDWSRVKSQDVVYVPYGIFDSWTLYALGLATVTGTTGASLSADLLKPLEKQFVIIPDKGEEKQAYHLESGLGWRADIKKIDYPDYQKDIDEIRRTFGAEYLSHLLGTQEIYYERWS